MKMNRIASFLLAVVLLVSLLPAGLVWAADITDSGTCGENLTWTLDSEGLLTISGTGDMEDFNSVGPWGCFIEAVVIEPGVTSIGKLAFYGCSNLTSVAIPDSVTSIGEAAFIVCSGLRSVMIPDSVTSIGVAAFYCCEDLVSVTIPDGVNNIGDMAFYGCSSLASVTIPESVTIIGGSSFSGCGRLASVTIPNSVTTIENNAFYGCSSLTSVTIPGSVTSVGGGAFYNCSSLVSVIIMEGVTSIGEQAFYGCSSLESITIPGSVTSLEYMTFSNCISLRTSTISEGVSNIGELVFYGCSSLESVAIPGSVSNIGNSAFSDCGSMISLMISEGVTGIGEWAFSGCSSLTSVTIPDSMTDIGVGAFYGCSSLESVTIPGSVTSLGHLAFSNCSSLTSVTLMEGVTSIGEGAFSTCSGLISVTIPNSVSSIGNGAFGGCSSLTSATIPNSVSSIGEGIFSDCSSLSSITIPDSVTSIGDWAFSGCSSLTSVTIPEGVTNIGEWTFSYCSSLTAVTIPESVVSIGICAFYDCDSLEHVLYKGKNSSWNQLSVDWGNDSLLDAVVHVDATGDEIVNGVCTICNLAHEHSYFDTVTAPTCAEAGYTTYTCACGDSYVADQVPALGHTEVKDTGKEATCTATGLTEGAHCSTCGAVLVAQETTPVKEHIYDNGKVTTEPTEESAGIRTYTCIVCGTEKTETIPALEHTHSYTSKITAPTCEKAGYTTYTCSCGDSYVTDMVAALGHDGITDEGKAPTCTEEGLTEGSHCGRCGEVLAKQETVAPNGHSWGQWVETVKPDESHDGVNTRMCTVCGETETEAVDNNIFTDVKQDRFEDAILWAYYNNITTGTGDGTTFSPENACTRKQIVTFLWRAAGEPEPKSMVNPFKDVKSDRFEKAILWAYYAGITAGTGDGSTFSPENTCTRKQIVTFLWRYNGQPAPKSMENKFVDVKNDRFTAAILWAAEQGITTGTGDGTTFSPEDPCTRKQIVTFLFRNLNK